MCVLLCGIVVIVFFIVCYSGCLRWCVMCGVGWCCCCCDNVSGLLVR